MADSEPQKFECKGFFKRIVEKVDWGVGGGVPDGPFRGVFQMVSLWQERHCESVRFVRVERNVPHVGPACDFIQICRE